jgi:hypothetical protein
MNECIVVVSSRLEGLHHYFGKYQGTHALVLPRGFVCFSLDGSTCKMGFDGAWVGGT